MLLNNRNQKPCPKCGREPRQCYDRVDGTARCPRCKLVFKGTHIPDEQEKLSDNNPGR